jgi:hypothetical protein
MGATVRTLDFTGVKEGGEFRPRRRPEGDYYAHIVKVEDHESKSGNDTWLFTIKIDGDSRAAYPYYVGTDDNQLWKVRGIFVGAGVQVPSKRVKADPNKLVGKAVGVALEDDEYEGRVKSTIAAVFPVSDLDDAMNEPGKASSAKAKSRASEEDDDVDEDEDEEPPARKPAKKAAASKRRAPEPEPEDDEDEDVEDEEEEEDEPPAKPARKASAKSAPAKKATRRKAPPPDEDDDEDLDLDEL